MNSDDLDDEPHVEYIVCEWPNETKGADKLVLALLSSGLEEEVEGLGVKLDISTCFHAPLALFKIESNNDDATRLGALRVFESIDTLSEDYPATMYEFVGIQFSIP